MSSWIPSFFNQNSDPTSDDGATATSSSTKMAPGTHFSGVKSDLSAVFRGVTAFLAPPPSTFVAEVSSSSSASVAIAGIKNDLAEIQDSFKAGLSLIASKFSNNFLHLGEFDDGHEAEEHDGENDAVGITEEVVDFARKLSKRPELWIDFPLSLADDFNLSDHQQEHAANIDYLVPELMKLRQKIGSRISYGKFWIIYFIILLPRFNEADSELLSTPQIVEAREMLLKKLQNKSDTVRDASETERGSADEYVSGGGDESTSQEIVSSRKFPDNTQDVESQNSVCEEETDSFACVNVTKRCGNEENVSLSDLSEKLPGNRVWKNKICGEWIEVHGNEGDQKNMDQTSIGGKEDLSDWLAVDESDFDNLDSV